MRQWTEAERKRQSEMIKKWQPWKTSGVRTPSGKAKSRMNALKHGAYSEEAKAVRDYFVHCRRQLEKLQLAVCLIDIHNSGL